MNVRWGIFWRGDCLTTGFFEGISCYKLHGEVWSMGIVYDTIDSLGEMKLVDTREEERIMDLRGGEK